MSQSNSPQSRSAAACYSRYLFAIEVLVTGSASRSPPLRWTLDSTTLMTHALMTRVPALWSFSGAAARKMPRFCQMLDGCRYIAQCEDIGSSIITLNLKNFSDPATAVAVPIDVNYIADRICNGRLDSGEWPWAPSIRMSVVRRERASSAELACTVASDPLWPVFRALIRSKASGPRTSPMMRRSGR